MKLKQLLLFVLCITFFACNTEPITNFIEEEFIEEEDITDSVLLKKLIYNKGTDDEYIEIFNYDGNKLTSVNYGDDTKNVYTYDNDNNLVRDDFFSEGELNAYVILEYNSDEKVATYTETFLEASGLSDRKYKHVITYNNDGTLTDEIYVSFSDTDFELDYTETITLDGKNIAEIDDDDGYKTSYTYDDKNGMFKNIHAIEILNILNENEFGAEIYGNTNNIVSYVESDTSSSDNYSDRYEYTYNEKNYPKTCIYTYKYGDDDDDDDDDDDVETIEYFYE